MPSSTPTTLAAAALAAVAASGAAAFVSPAQARKATASALRRGASAAPASAAESGSGLPLGVMAAATTLLSTAAVRRSTKDAVPVRRRAAAAAEETPPPFDPAKQVGVTLPMNYFDPLGLCKDEETFYDFRCAELKHGRVAMVAALGAVVPHWIKFPGFEEVPNGLKAVVTPPGTFGLLAVLAAAGAVEATVWVQDKDKEPGNFGDPAGFGQYYPEWRNRELNNCRMAMLSIVAIIVTELITGLDGPDQIWKPQSNLPVE